MPGAMRKRSVLWRRCVQEVAVEQRLALLGQAQRVVELGARLARHQAAQELHVGRRNLHVDHEVGAREAEQDQQLILSIEQRIDHELARGRMQDGQCERQFLKAVDHLAHHIRTLVPVEQAGQHLDLEVGAKVLVIEQAHQHLVHGQGVALEILEIDTQAEVTHHAPELVEDGVAARVVGTVGGAAGRVLGLDVLGADGRAHEDEVVLEIAAVQDLGRHRVEEGLGQLGLAMVDQHADVQQLDLLPHLHRLLGGLELALEPPRAFAHAQVVELDALALAALLAVPVRRLEAVAGARRFGAKQLVMSVEPVDHGPGDVPGQRRIEFLQQHKLSTGRPIRRRSGARIRAAAERGGVAARG
jgi:hypothetical protein